MCQAAVTATIVTECKAFVDAGDLGGLERYIHSLRFETEFPCAPDWTTMFQRVYLHACLKRKRPIVDFLTRMYDQMDPLQKIVLRHVFPYGRTLLAR